MITAKPNELELLKFWQESDPAAGIRINFPIDAQTGAASSTAVYFEVESEQHIGTHTHSAEEILFILEGEAEAVVGDERGRLSKEEIAVVPGQCAPRPLQPRRGYAAGSQLLLQRGGSDDLRRSACTSKHEGTPRGRDASFSGLGGLGRSTFH